VTTKKNKALGKIWEAYILAENKTLWARRRALVDKAHEDLRAVRRDGHKVEAIYAGTSWVDFFGIVAGGKMVSFDAKATDGTRWQPSQLASHQRDTLQAVHDLGGIAFVYVLCYPDESKHVIPIADVVPGKGFDLTLDTYRKLPGETWLDTLERQWNRLDLSKAGTAD
jgi:penicillin-binding protein-related factor A (putative recombinase)